ncbi:MAG: hypothetical protein ACOX8N_10165 [Christensenellales bacterium]|jgi:hypothetical protein
MYTQNRLTRAANCVTPRQLQVMNTLRRLWMEHGLWTRSFIVSTAFSNADINDVTRRLLRNPADFAAVLIPFYGAQAARAFENLLMAHLQIAA